MNELGCNAHRVLCKYLQERAGVTVKLRAMIRYSHPTHDDIPALIALWNASIGGFPLSARLLNQTMRDDPYYEVQGCFIARDDSGAIIGWVMSKSMKSAGSEVGRFANRGGIGALCVHPQFRRRGIGSELLGRAENWLTQNGSPLTTLYFPHHLLPGVPCEAEAAIALFLARGYGNWHQTYDVARELNEFRVPPQVLEAMQANPKVQIRPCREDESAALIEFVAREFPGAWTYSTRDHFARGGRASDFIVAVENGVVIGFCHTADFTSARLISSTHWFGELGEKFGGLGPIGMAQSERKRGLGLALCALSVSDLQGRGVEKMAIDWTSLLDFYGKLGFTKSNCYLQGERAIG